MTKKRSHLPVISFGPELFEALIKGSKERVEIGPMPYRVALKLQYRINHLRAAMQTETHEHATLVLRARTSIVWPEDTPVSVSRNRVKTPIDRNTPCTVIIEPHDSEFGTLLKAAGIAPNLTELSSDPLDEFPLAKVRP